MKCIRCNRPIFVPAVSIPTRNGMAGYGPVCARKAGLLQNPSQRIAATRKSPSRPEKRHCRVLAVGDELTMDMFEGMNA